MAELSIVVYEGDPGVAHALLATRDPHIVQIITRMIIDRLTDERDEDMDLWTREGHHDAPE
jgi:hypothetical protein